MLKTTLALLLVVILLYVAACDTKDPILCGDDQRKSRYMPSMTAHREALLLFLPLVEEMPDTVHVEVRMNDELVDTRLLTHPNDLLAADIPTACNVRYSNAAWSLRLSYDLMKEGLSLHFIVDRDAEDEQQGTLPADALEFSPASSLVFRTARLGMLTHVDETAGHFTLNDPILAATDYFQTLPVSKLVMGSYANIELDRVMVQSGVIYDQERDGASATTGDIYSGDMRENVGKAQISTGINLANIGVSSHNMSQNYPHGFKQITNHRAWGMYTNDVDGQSVQ